ncbi:MAG TPA: glycosyltransferase [Phycisphaerales bacterium]|nr:glycosyltransferase [Phycisphaerales bacterium]
MTVQSGEYSICILVNAMAPSRVWMHTDLAARLPDARIATLQLFDVNNQAWALPEVVGTELERLGPGEVMPPRTTLRTLGRSLRKGARAIGESRRRRVRLLVVNGYNYAECWIMLAWARLAGVPAVLMTDSNIAADAPRSRAVGLAKKLVVGAAVRLARGVFCAGSAGERYAVKYGADPARVFVVPFGVDPALFEPLSGPERARTLRDLGADPSRSQVLCSGRLAAVKAWDVALDAFARVAPERPGWGLILAGDGEQRDALLARVPAPLRERVRFVGAINDPARMTRVVRSCSCLLHTASHEPWGMSVQEAIAAGLPAVVSDVTGAAFDLVADGENGRRVGVGDVGGFARALLEATEPATNARWSAGARRVYADWLRAHDRCEALWRALRMLGVDAPPPRPHRSEVLEAPLVEVRARAAPAEEPRVLGS